MGKRGLGKVTEMVKDERGGSEIINHNKSRERDPPSSDDRAELGTDEFKSSSSSTFRSLSA